MKHHGFHSSPAEIPSPSQSGIDFLFPHARSTKEQQKTTSLREALAASKFSINKSIPSNSLPSWSVSKRKHHPSLKIAAKDFMCRFGTCFAYLKKKQQNDGFPLKELSVNSASTDASTLASLQLFYHPKSFPHQPLDNRNGAVVFTMAELVAATANFSPSLKIGQGGSGTVYKGRLRDGRMVAIKRAKRNLYDKQLSAEFRNEVRTLSNVEHLNLVKFIGYLEEENERILVVEYVAKGNLRQHLDVERGPVLDLATRLDIAIDVAHALTYLHLYADQSIIHRDVKSSNILLTENYRAKVADFGFSRLSPWDVEATHVSTQVKGTAGYLDPEYLKTYQLTQKSDVYSFGVLLVEIVTGRKPIEMKREAKERMTVRWAFQMFNDGNALETLDPKLSKTDEANLMVEKMLELAFQCTASCRQDRPSMKRTAELLWNIRKDYRSLVRSNSFGGSRVL